MRRRLLLLLLSALLLTGCRTRVLSDPALADTVVTEETAETPEEMPEETAETPEEMPEETPTEPPQVVEETQLPDETADTVLPGEAAVVSAGSPQQLQVQTSFDVLVTYDANGGDTRTATTTVRTGGPYGPQPECTRRGYAFDGWWTAPGGGTQVLPDTVVTRTDAHTLYAHWQSRRGCTVTLDGNGGRVKAKEAVLTLSDGDVYGALPTPLREGYTFDGWFTDPTAGEEVTADTVFSGSADQTLYAHWTYEPYAYWSFTLRNRTQQVYLCQQASVYFETEQDHVTVRDCPLVTGTGSLNIAENREDTETTDDWVLAKAPQVVVKCAASTGEAAAVKQRLAARFPEQRLVVVSAEALSGSGLLYAQLALAKQLYGDWYTDVDLSTVAAELGVSENVISF
jgi:uncharacterized repeat protein (TIGR02543 family)